MLDPKRWPEWRIEIYRQEYLKAVMEKNIREVGAVVRLRSGGPKMTVVELTLTDYVLCAWFTKGVTYTRGFYIKALKEAK